MNWQKLLRNWINILRERPTFRVGTRRGFLVGLLVIYAGLATMARADEGMWTFDNFPIAAVNKEYGTHIDQAWLDHVRLAAVRLSSGCSASLVTAHGLVLTNHHCVRECAQQLSTAPVPIMRRRDFRRGGARTRSSVPGWSPKCW